MTSNETRAERAENVLRQYVEAKGEVFENSGSEIADLIADLLHLAERADYGDDPSGSILRLALLHFDAERNDPEDVSPSPVNCLKVHKFKTGGSE